MTGERKVSASAARHPLKILAVFALAFTLQGMTLAVFQGDRDAHKTEQAGPWSLRTGAPIMATETFSVTNTEDGGPGSLRQAIETANESPGLDRIQFLFEQPVTLTLSSSLVITDPVWMEAHGPWLTDTHPGWFTVDAKNLSQDVFVVLDAPGTCIQRMRLINIAGGYGIRVQGASGGTAIISNTIQTGIGGILLDNTSTVTVTHNALLDLVETAVEARNSSNLWLLQNRIRAGDIGIGLLDGVSNVAVISNTLLGTPGAQSLGIVAAGAPAPTGIMMLGNYFTDTLTPILLGPGANNDFPAPKIVDANMPFTGTATITVTAESTADPGAYTYPLSMDTYLVRDRNYLPLGRRVLYQRTDYPNAITYTVFFSDVLVSDQLALIATTANPSTSAFSPPVGIGSLPVELTSFEAVVDGSEILLDWTTGSETNNAGFAVEHRSAGLRESPEATWRELDFVPGHGSTSNIQSYSYRVHGLSVGVHHFRLKQIDHDGVFEYSPVVEAGIEVPGEFVLEPAYPNPFNPSTTVRFAVASRQPVVVTLYDAAGREVRELYRGRPNANEMQTVDIDGSLLASGTYHVRLAGANFVTSEVIALVK